MKVQFGQFYLDIDVNKTREFYKKMEYVSHGCSCSGCRNFEQAVDTLSNEIIYFFESIGIDMKKITEVYVNTVNSDGSLLYGGFYHLCGTILSGESAWIELPTSKSKSRIFHWDHLRTYPVSKNFYISFQKDCALVEDGFPMPVLQLEIEAVIPWVLEEPNIYI